MSDKFVTVATFSLPYEGELAKNLLQNEGIESFLTGDLTADVFSNNLGLGDQVRLQVHEQDAQRAAVILAAQQAALDDDWEDRAEHDPDVWVCSLCGSPISNSLSVCYACQTPREGIRAERPPSATAIRPTPTSPPPPDPVQKREDVTADAPVTPARAAASLPAEAEEGEAGEEEQGEEDEGDEQGAPRDDLARRAFWASLFGVMMPCPVLPFAWYYELRVLLEPGELSPGGRRHFYWAALINGLGFLGWLALCAGLGPYR